MHISQMHPEFPGANQLASEKKWACQYCNKKFSTKAYLIVHHKIHRGEKPFKCDKCSYTAVSKDSIKKHDERAHGTMRPLSCNLCSKTFMYYSHKKAHMLRHYNLKPFNCELCTRSFMLKRHLIDHMRLHEGKQNFRCDLCNVAYVLPDSLRKHKDMHLNVPLKCHICETDFWITGRYNRHMQKHRREFHGNARSGNKPYKCQSCSKGFKQRRFLVRHIADGCQRKGNSRLLKCTECDFKFFDQKALKIHMKIFHNLKEHSCYICAEAFKRISQLNQHLIEKHNEHTNESVKKEIPYSSSAEDCVGKGIVLLPNESDEEANKILYIDETPIKDSIKLEPIDSFETSFDCFSCDDRFDSQDSLQSHCKLAHESDSPADNMPSITSLVVKEEKSPLKFDDSVNSESFDQLGYEFVPVEGGTSDDVDTEIETYECTVCGASFATYELCQRHYESRHEKKNKFKRGRRKK
ncbi:hypothetical protein HAZT_HAZT003197 [Hyalella azteca]|nr:hypothetical protein HAZT_HAZT003197 [Hyalella azteca]